jgi:hypothetical protein
MFQLFKFSDASTPAEQAAVWVTNGVTRSWAQTPAYRDALIVFAAAQGLPTNIAQVTTAQLGAMPVVGPTP